MEGALWDSCPSDHHASCHRGLPEPFKNLFPGIHHVKELPAEERKNHRQLSVRPLVGAYFTWVRETLLKVPPKSKTQDGFNYSLNHEKYLKVFLDDGEVPIDNNAAEQSIQRFCIRKKNWVTIDTVADAKSSVIIYSIAETANANSFTPVLFRYALSTIYNHQGTFSF